MVGVECVCWVCPCRSVSPVSIAFHACCHVHEAACSFGRESRASWLARRAARHGERRACRVVDRLRYLRMCGRYTHLLTWAQLHRLLRLTSDPIDLPRRYNIAPTQEAPVVRTSPDGGRAAHLLRWGLVPSWAKDLSIGNTMINARGETLATKPAFRVAFRKRRCVVPASGFYEWKKMEGSKTKQPFYITSSDEGPLMFGGLWESWTSPEGEIVRTFTIITTTPNEMMAEIHDRMPLILDASDTDRWLDPKVEDASDLIRSFPPELMLAKPVSTLVNSPRNDVPECVQSISKQ